MEYYDMGDGYVLKTHDQSACEGEFCCIHNPSPHPLRNAPLDWRSSKKIMERRCRHGVGHPDPDSIAFLIRILGEGEATARAIHGCCPEGCCSVTILDGEIIQREIEA